MQTGKKAGCPIPSGEIFAFMLGLAEKRKKFSTIVKNPKNKLKFVKIVSIPPRI